MIIRGITFIIFFFCSFTLLAQTSYTSNVVNGDWDDPNSWLPNTGFPGAVDDVLVLSGHTISVTDTEEVNNIIINGILDHFGKSLTIYGAYEVNGLHQSDEDINMNGVGETINGTGTLRLIGNKDFQINDDRTILSSANLVINLDAGSQDMIIKTATVTNEGSVELIGGMKRAGGDGTWINASNSFLRVFGSVQDHPGFTFTSSASGNTVEYSGSSRTLTLPTSNTYYNFIIDGSGTKTLDGSITINGDFENKASLNTDGYDIDIKGNWTELGTFTPGTGEVTFSGTSDQSVSGAESFYDLNVSTSSGELSIDDDIVIQNLFTLNGIILAGSNQVTVGTAVGTGSLTYTSGLIDGKLEQYTSNAASQTISFPVGAPKFDISVGYKLVTLSLTSSSISSGGSILVEFVNSVPGNGGSAWIEGSTFNNTFSDGYWQVTDKNGFALTTFNLSLKINELEGFIIDNSERVLAGTSPNWSFQGSHGSNNGIIVSRTGLNTFEDFALASTNSCTAPGAPSFTAAPTTVCINSSDTYTVTLVSGYTYYWTVSGGTFNVNGQTSYNAFEYNSILVDWGLSGGNYEVSVLAFDPLCTFSDISTIAVTLEPFTPSSISGRTVLEQNTANEPYSITGLGPNYSYNWTINGGSLDPPGDTDFITADWGGQGAASVVVNSETTDCPSVTSPNIRKFITLFSTFVSQDPGDLDDDVNWVGGTAPGDLDNIRVEHVMTGSDDKRYNHVIISSTGSLTINNKSIEITGLFGNYGSLEVTMNKNLTLNASKDYNLEGSGTVIAQNMILFGSDRSIDSLATLTWDISSDLDIDINLTNKGSLTLLDLPLSTTGSGMVDTSDPDNVIIYGGADQNFSLNPVIPSYNNLTLSGSGTKTSTGVITVNGDLNVSTGVSLDAETLNISGGGSVASGASITITTAGNLSGDVLDNQSGGTIEFNDATASSTSTGYIDGPVIFTAGSNTSFEYPIGDGTIWARMGIGTLTSGSQFTGQYFYSDPQVAYNTNIDATDFADPAASVSTEEYWVLSYGGGGASSAIVTLYWQDGTRSGISDLGDLTITKHDGTDWGRDGNPGVGTSTTGTTSSGTVYTTLAYTSFSPFTFASAMGLNPLPIELIDFTGTPIETGVLLEWETAIEINNDYFEVESSDDGESFRPIVRIPGKGNTSGSRVYRYIDAMPYQGINYYRLKQTDYDGTFTYTRMISVLVDNSPFKLLIYPNPVSNGKFTLSGNIKSIDQPVAVRMINSMGEVKFQKLIQPDYTRFEVDFAIDSLPSGVYYISLQQGIFKSVRRVIIY